MTDIKCIELSEKLLNGQLENKQFIKLVDDILVNREHLELYKTMRDLRNYFSIMENEKKTAEVA